MAGIHDAAIVHTDLTFNAADDVALSPDDIVVAAAPVYGGKIAPVVKQRLRGLRGNNARCIVVAIYGNRAFENAVADFASFMTDAGLTVCGAAAFIGEHSILRPPHPSPPVAPTAATWTMPALSARK